MIKITFNEELDQYLKNRKEEDESYDSNFSLFWKEFKAKFSKMKLSKEKIEYDETEEYEQIPEKRSLMSRIFRRKTRHYEDEEPEEEEDEEIERDTEKEDLKELIKILHKWIEKLPKDNLDQFKRSQDFEKYKEGLKKLNMIK